MRNLFKQAHADAASQFVNDPEPRHDTSMLKKFMVIGTTALALFGGTVQSAHADPGAYGQVFGAAIGALVGAKATQHTNDWAVRGAVMTAAGAAGGYAGEVITKQLSQPSQQSQRGDRVYMDNNPQSQRVERVYVESMPQPQRVERVYVDNNPQPRTSYQQGGYRQVVGAQRSDGPVTFSPEEMNMPPLVVGALTRAGSPLLAPGDAPLSNDPVGTSRLAKATDRLLASAGIFAARKDKWDDAATLVGPEGTNARTHAADDLSKARAGVDEAAKEWAQVRNVLAQRGLDVGRIDNVVRDRLANVKEADRYEYRVNQQAGYRY